MAIELPSSPALPGRLEIATGEIIESDHWTDFVKTAHRLFGDHGVRAGGQVFDPEFETTSTSYTATNENGDLDLDRVHASSRLQRVLEGSKVKVTLEGFGQDVDVQIEVVRHDDGSTTTIGTDSISCGSSSEWDSVTLSITEDDTLEGGTTGNDPQLLAYKITARTNDSTGKLWHYDVYETILDSAADLPDGS